MSGALGLVIHLDGDHAVLLAQVGARAFGQREAGVLLELSS